jgi:hypothetical protein
LIRYLPFEAGPHRLAMAVKPLDAADWIEIDHDLGADLAVKRDLLTNRHADVFAEVEGSRAAQAEALAELIAHLSAFHPDVKIDVDDGLAPLDAAGRLVQEDLCLMEADGAGAYRLTAASLCFPTRWLLADKIGRPMPAIHGPVPGYDERLARPMDRFFTALTPETPIWRLNWSLVDSPELHLAMRHGETALNAEISTENAGENIWLRVERQTLRRLPATRAIIFTIRIYRTPLWRVAAEPGAAARLAAAIDALPDEMRAYKSIPPFEAALRSYLAACYTKVR